MFNTQRKTAFIGILFAIKSSITLFDNLVVKDASLKYILMYKFSQDHLELFFGAVRSCGGFNNNPTSQQFTAAYKRLLLRSCIAGENGNCKKVIKILKILNMIKIFIFSLSINLFEMYYIKVYLYYVGKKYYKIQS